jgi:hypothetical protein
MACVTSSRRRAVLVDQAGETVETYDLVVAARRASRRQAQVPEVGCLPRTCVRALKRPIFVQRNQWKLKKHRNRQHGAGAALPNPILNSVDGRDFLV